MNIKFSYLYRDGGNYKQYGEEVFTNNSGLSCEEIEAMIRECLYDGEFFYVHEWGLRDLHYYPWDNDLDHTWHEFDCVEVTSAAATMPMDISALLDRVSKAVV